MTAILGISAFYHDSAAALVVDGEIVAAAQQERFSRRKHDADFPAEAIQYCLREAGLTADRLDYVAFYEKPLLKFDRLLETWLATAPFGLRSFLAGVPVWLKRKLFHTRELRRGLDARYRRRFVFPEHHQSHAASAFFPSPFEDAAILTMDGVGEWATASHGSGQGNRIRLTHELRFPHSPGLLYSAFTYYCGFRVNSGEYKLMGLAPYGEPKYATLILERLIDLKDDGSFRIDPSYFRYISGLTMTSPKFHRLFGGPPRSPEGQLTERHADLAASIQQVTEEIVLRMARHVHQQAKSGNLCLAGGVALNAVANGRLLREGPFERVWIQPAAGDAGGAIGAALHVWHQLLERPRTPQPFDSQRGSFLGPSFSEPEIEAVLRSGGARYHSFADDESLCRFVTDCLVREQVVGWCQGRMEFGPRALGARSILGDPRSDRMQSVMNLKIKFRESFRPFAPAVLREHAAEFFEVPPNADAPYMLTVATVRPEKREPLAAEAATLMGFDRLKVRRSIIPAVTHVDYSARLQTVDPQRHGRFHTLLKMFAERTGVPVLINTSFNVRGEPIVCTPQDAYHCFLATGMDVLVLERFVLLKAEQPAVESAESARHLAQFAPD